MMRDLIALGAVALMLSGFVALLAGATLHAGLWGFRERER